MADFFPILKENSIDLKIQKYLYTINSDLLVYCIRILSL